MSSFADRFKDKAQIVGKQGQGAMLVEQQCHTKPKTQNLKHCSHEEDDKPSMSLARKTGTDKCQPDKKSYTDHIRAIDAGATGTPITTDNCASEGRDTEPSINTENPRNYLPVENHNENRQKIEPMKFGFKNYKGDDEVKVRLSDKYVLPKTGESPTSSTPTHSGAYKPYSLDDWRNVKDTLSLVKGGVGRNPSDTDKQRLYRVLQNRAKVFGCETREVNKLIGERAVHEPKPLTPPVPEEVLEKRERLNKMKDFAKNIPKPKVATKHNDQEISPLGDRVSEGPSGLLHKRDMTGREETLADLEDQHRRDQEALEALKVKIGM